MAGFVNISRKIQLGTAWTGTAPGLPGTQTISGTITSPQDISAFARAGNPSTKVAMQDGSTFGTGGFVAQYPGLKSGDDIVIDLLSDYSASQIDAIVRTTLGGLGALVYLDLLPTNAARSVTNPSFVAAAYISGYVPVGGATGEMGAGSLTLSITGKFDYLTA